jgi:hypothetical protein
MDEPHAKTRTNPATGYPRTASGAQGEKEKNWVGRSLQKGGQDHARLEEAEAQMMEELETIHLPIFDQNGNWIEVFTVDLQKYYADRTIIRLTCTKPELERKLKNLKRRVNRQLAKDANDNPPPDLARAAQPRPRQDTRRAMR